MPIYNRSSIKFWVLAATLLVVSSCAYNTLPQNSSAQVETQPAAPTVQPVTIAPIADVDIPPKALPDEDLWQRARGNFQLDLSNNSRRTQVQRNWYASHQDYLDRVSTRSERYLFHVVSELEKRDMPGELALLPIVESAFDPFAYSHGRASGMWQFIPGTGKRFGLKQNWWYDGRRDIVESTRAALDYLQYLHKRFDNDWLLALAAYNSGEGNVGKAIRKNKKRGRNTDFWSLSLPKETRAYVPKLIALAQILDAPEQYKAHFKPVSNTPYFTQVDIGSQLDLAQAAELAEISLDELYLLNPGFNQWSTPPGGPHRISVPIDQAEVFTDALAALPKDQRISWIRYKIKRGDSLSTIANKHHTTPAALRKINNLKNNRIVANKVLFIPVASRGADHYVLSAAQRLQNKQNRVASSGKVKSIHVTRSGDSFWTISRKFKVGMRQLASWNGMAPTDPLPIGKKLVIWSKPAKQAGNSRTIIRNVGYKVKRGDSLARIASRFNVSINDIVSWNGLDRNKYLQPGQSLKLYVDVTRASL